MRHPVTLLALAALLVAACAETTGAPVDQNALGYRTCEGYYDCGAGRYCNPDGFCWADCRITADCALVEPGTLCNRFGQCVLDQGVKECVSHADCGQANYCNGRCSSSGSTCGQDSECPNLFGPETCQGTCGRPCGHDNDCIALGDELECAPVGLCLLPGWERWIDPGSLPPTSCKQDSHCLVLGFGWACDCAKTPDPRTGIPRCTGGAESTCVPVDGELDLGDGPAASPAHAFRGIWGMRMEIAVMTQVPIIGFQRTYSSNLFLIKARHSQGDRLELEEKLCDLKLINFIDSNEEFTDLGWMVIPLRYLRSLAVLERVLELPAAGRGAPWRTTQSVEVRGAVLQEPALDPLPTRQDFEANPGDPRFWDQDEDGKVGMTTLMDGILRGEIYNVQRWKAIYEGEVLDPDHVRGLAVIENEQLVISASKASLVYDSQSVMHADPTRTYFRLERLTPRFPDKAPGDITCADLIRYGERSDSWLRHTPHLMDVPDP
jgi:hypothetical protein